VLASLDPQGEMLHEMIEGVVNSLEDKFASVFASVLLDCGQLSVQRTSCLFHVIQKEE